MTHPSLYTNRQVICSALMSQACCAVEVSNSMAIIGVEKNVAQQLHTSLSALSSVVLAMGEWGLRDKLNRISGAEMPQLERIARLLHAIDNSKRTKYSK